MNFFEVIFYGWYKILDKTIYSNATDNNVGIGPKEHSFFIAYLFHGINLWTLLSYVLAKHFDVNIPVFIGLSLALVVFLMGYFLFFKRLANKTIVRNVSTGKTILYVIIALFYVGVSTYLMFKVGDYVREVVN